jgi:hypothetical protein
MVKKSLLYFGLFAIVMSAFFTAQEKKVDLDPLLKIQVGMSAESLSFLGPAISANDRERVYWLENGSTFLVTLFEGKITGGWLSFQSPLKIQEHSTQKLRFVQINLDHENDPSWFFAGAPSLGKVFKINQAGLIESIIWVKPFATDAPAKNLQALYQDFTIQQSLSL